MDIATNTGRGIKYFVSGCLGALALTGCSFLPLAARVPANPPSIFSTDVKAPKEALIVDPSDPSKLIRTNFKSDWEHLLIAEGLLLTTDNEANRKTYLASGFDVSSQLCTAWLNILVSAQRDVEFGHGVASTLGSLTTTMMGAFNAAASEIAAVSATFAATGTTYELSKATFLFTPDLNVVKGKIEDGQRAYRQTVSDAGVSGASEAKSAVQAHHQLCSSSKIQELIQTAVIKSSYSVDLPGKLSEIVRSRIELESVDLNKVLGNAPAPIPVEVLKRLYFAVFHPTVFPADQLNVLETALYKKIVSGTGNVDAMSRLQGIGALGDFEKSVPKVQQAVEQMKGQDIVNFSIPANTFFRTFFDEQMREERVGEAKVSIVTMP